MLFSDAELRDACDTDLDSDDSLDDELETLEELDEVLECFDWESSTLLTSPHSRRCLICVISLSSLAILIFWSLITFLTSESFLSESTFRMGPDISERSICIQFYSIWRGDSILSLKHLHYMYFEHTSIWSLRYFDDLMHLSIFYVKFFSHGRYFLFQDHIFQAWFLLHIQDGLTKFCMNLIPLRYQIQWNKINDAHRRLYYLWNFRNHVIMYV